MLIFYIFVENPLQAMTALSLQLVDITRDWVSSFVMLCKAFTAADFSFHAGLGWFLFSVMLQEQNASCWD